MALSTVDMATGITPQVRLLIKQGEHDVNSRDSENQTPLHYACARGHLGVVNMLISEFIADVSIQNSEYNTPLHVAALRGEKDLIVMSMSEAILLHSACFGGNVSLVETLIREYKADINDKDSKNLTPLHSNGKQERRCCIGFN